ncbi:MAG: SDR family NAD(P)-dependent oxidoreductase [Magnetococcales bacterium]|nr:SDR family NAD(P)-dependent oxidoreductase [Magnetococcales bacterium]
MLETHQTEESPPTALYRLLNGVKLAFGCLLGLPFLLVLLPLWSLYRWNERRQGHADPENPWHLLWHALRGRPETDAWLQRPSSPRITAVAPAILQPAPVPGPHELALLTGGSSRLGRIIAPELANQGYRVILTYHRANHAAAAVVAQIQAQNGQAHALAMDLNDPDHMAKVVKQIVDQWGTPRLLINNASLFRATPLQQLDWQTLEHMLRINLHAPLWLAARLGQRMQQEAQQGAPPGQIIQLCDIWGERALAGHSVYSTSKAGLIMATRSLARELAPLVRVNGIAPGAIIGPAEDPGWQTLLRHTPLARQASPQAVLQAIRYLLHTPYVTGEILHVDGGRSLL